MDTASFHVAHAMKGILTMRRGTNVIRCLCRSISGWGPSTPKIIRFAD